MTSPDALPEHSAAKSVYFPNLNGLRFIAAFGVFVHHVAQLQFLFGLPSAWGSPVIGKLGHLGVVLFFVLSGFLITYLLLAEQKATDGIAIREFYIRRILRIWPLYYLILILGFFVMPHIGAMAVPGLTNKLSNFFWIRAALFFCFLPNVGMYLSPAVPYASQSWSVGVEEQFYLLWPALLKRTRAPIRALFGVIAVYLVVRYGLEVIAWRRPSRLFTTASGIWSHFSIDCMAIGGIVACVLFEKKTAILNVLFRRDVQATVWALLVVMISFGVEFAWFAPLRVIHTEIYAVLFSVVIVNMAANPARLFSLENPVAHYLGKISYGLYMYHAIAIVLAIRLLSGTGLQSTAGIYLVGLPLTIALSSLSYEFFEKPFLTIKSRFAKIVNGDEARLNTRTRS